MTRTISDKPTDALVAALVEYEEQRRLAIRREDTAAANRLYDKTVPVLKELVLRESEGRDALEALLEHASAFVRLSAAAKVLGWAPDQAIPVLGRLYTEDLKPAYTPAESGSVRLTAKELLFRHFGIRSFNPNHLIEPLKAYGIDWPYRPHFDR